MKRPKWVTSVCRVEFRTMTTTQPDHEHERDATGLCPSCGHDQFGLGLDDLGHASAVCSECGWAVKADDLQSLVETPQRDDGSPDCPDWRSV
jgi:hypothetical protein